MKKKRRKGGNGYPLIYEVNIILMPKPDKNITRKLQTNIPYEYRYLSIYMQTFSNWIQQHRASTVHHDQMGFILGKQSLFKIQKSIYLIHFLNRIKEKNQRIISTYMGKVFDKA